jgi:hypothetical protein
MGRWKDGRGNENVQPQFFKGALLETLVLDDVQTEM